MSGRIETKRVRCPMHSGHQVIVTIKHSHMLGITAPIDSQLIGANCSEGPRMLVGNRQVCTSECMEKLRQQLGLK